MAEDSSSGSDAEFDRGEGVLELHCHVARVFGISRATGKCWLDSARYGDLGTLKSLLHSASGAHKDGAMKLLHYNGTTTSYGFIGNIALHWAAANGDVAMATLLLEAGTSVNYQNKGGSTPLHSASANGQPSTVRLLLSYGASTTIVDCCGDTASDVARPQLKSVIQPIISMAQNVFQLLFEQRDMEAALQKCTSNELRVILANAGVAAQPQGKEALVDACLGVVTELLRRSQQQAPSELFAAKLYSKLQKRIEGTKANVIQDELLMDEGLQHAAQAKQLGNEAFARGELKNAIRHYTTAICINPADATFFSNRSVCYFKLCQHSAAAQDAAVAVKLVPEWPKAYYRLGLALAALGRYEDAVESLSHAAQLLRSNSEDATEVEAALTNLKQRQSEEKASCTRSAAHTASPFVASAAPDDRPAVPVAHRRPWFDCPTCENRTRDASATPCCNTKICGTCVKRRSWLRSGRCFVCGK